MPSGSHQACAGLCRCLEQPVVGEQEGTEMGKWQLQHSEISEDGFY